MEELKEFEKLYQLIEQFRNTDETSRELYGDMKSYAHKYADMRYRFSEMEREEKADNDAHRTRIHNCFMDSVRIYFRYLQKNGINVPDIAWLETDRKVFGDFGCFFVFGVECGER